MPYKRSFRPISEKTQENSQLTCTVKNCYRNRYRIDPYCRKHREARRYWGHPEAKAIRREDYGCELEDVHSVVLKNLDHPGIQHGIEFFENWLQKAANGFRSVPCPDLIARRYDAHVDPLDLVMEMATLWLLYSQSRGLVKSDLHLKYVMGSRLIRFIRCAERTRGGQQLECGEYVQKNIGILLVTICKAVERKCTTNRNPIV